MIQRIQTLYLAIGGIAVLLLLLQLPLAVSPQPAASSAVFADSAFTVQDQLPLTALVALAGIVALITIFLFRQRPLQVIFTWVVIALLATVIGWSAYIMTIEQAANPQPAIGSALPLAGLVLTWLAQRRIRKDDAVVRSMDRLR